MLMLTETEVITASKCYYFDLPYTETMYGTLRCYVQADNQQEAEAAIRSGDFTEIEWEQTDSDYLQYYQNDAECVQINCTQCKEEIIYGTDCNCTDGWNDPDIYTPDQLYSTNQLGN